MSKVFPPDQLVAEAVKTAEKMASFSKTIVAICKECVNASKLFDLISSVMEIFWKNQRSRSTDLIEFKKKYILQMAIFLRQILIYLFL